jgi:hypothetical protein
LYIKSNKSYVQFLNFDNIEWEDPTTGATLTLLKFLKGIADKMHSHSEATQITIGLKGELKMPPNDVLTKIDQTWGQSSQKKV